MEFSLFNLMTKPAVGPEHSDVYAQARTMTRMADDAGFDIAWFVEHHLSNYSISPSPLLQCVHMAPQTKNIRLGPAVVVLPFYEPLRLVEEICVADHLCDGRLVLGLGTGYQPREFEKFGFEIDDRLARGLEVWDVVHQGLTTGKIDYEGKHVRLHNADLSVAPAQKEIKTFAVGNAPEMRQRMVERNAIPMTTPAVGPSSVTETARRLFQETRKLNGLAESDFPFAVQRYVFITEDALLAERVCKQILVHARMAANMRKENPDLDGSDLRIIPFENEPTIDEILDRSLIGSAEKVAEKIVHEANTLGMTHLSVFMQIAGVPYSDALRSLDTFCDRVMPVVQSCHGGASRAS